MSLINQKDISEIQEVREFVSAQAALAEFKEQNAPVFEQFEHLAETYNQRLEAAEKICRANAISCGPFEMYQTQTKIDGQALHNAVGRENFVTIGGEINTKVEYKVDKARFEAAVARGLVTQPVIDRVVSVSPRYHMPGKVEMP
jgi:hypothetical protein